MRIFFKKEWFSVYHTHPNSSSEIIVCDLKFRLIMKCSTTWTSLTCHFSKVEFISKYNYFEILFVNFKYILSISTKFCPNTNFFLLFLVWFFFSFFAKINKEIGFFFLKKKSKGRDNFFFYCFTHLSWEGDMLVKKTLVFFESIFFLIHVTKLFIAILYASSVDTSTICFTSSSKDPCLRATKK